MNDWIPEVDVSPALARSLIEEQFPSVCYHASDSPMQEVGVGWDNIVYSYANLLFRFPRRLMAVSGVTSEMRLLPYLADHLPVLIPKPILLGVPSQGYPWPWFAYQSIPGQEIHECELSDSQRVRLACDIARVLRILHQPQHVQAIGHLLPQDPLGRTQMEIRIPFATRRLEDLQSAGLISQAHVWIQQMAPAEGTKGAPTTVVHGDLHFRHFLVDASNRLAGIIDWGDLCLSEPAMDLQLVFSLLPQKSRAAFFEVYGEVPEDALHRARVIAIYIQASLANYGHKVGAPSILKEALRGLHHASEP